VTAPKPNAELAYRVLDQIDAHPEQWDQTRWWKAADMPSGVSCGTAGCFAGWAVSLSGGRIARGGHDCTARVESGLGKLNGDYVPVAAAALLGLPMQDPWSEDEAENLALFHENNTREDLGRLVEEIFGPRLHDVGSVDGCRRCREGGLTAEIAWRECAHRADYLSPAEHEGNCPFHNHEVDEDGLPVDDVAPNAGSAS
jgi:hypothetical protein